MPPIYLISLDSSRQRRDSLVKQLRSAQISFELIKAIDGNKLTRQQLLSYRKEMEDYYRDNVMPRIMQKRGALTPAEIGCAQSHLRVYQEIVKKKIPYAVVLEDDVLLLDKHIKSILASIGLVENRWHIIFLDYIHLGVPSLFDRNKAPWGLWRYADRLRNLSHRKLSLNDYYFSTSSLNHRYQAPLKFWPRITWLPNYKLAKSVYKVCGSQAYAISYEGAKLLLRKAYPLHLPADGLLTEMAEAWDHTFVVTPRPMGLNPKLQERSTIGDERKENIRRAQWKKILDSYAPLLSSYGRYILALMKTLLIFLNQLVPATIEKGRMEANTETSKPSVYVISLKQDIQRRGSLIKQLECANIPYKLVEAVDGSQITVAQLRRYNRERRKYFEKLRYPLPTSLRQLIGRLADRRYYKDVLAKDMLAGEFGCALSHLKIYQEIIDKGISWSIILEDDAQLLFDASNLFNSIAKLEQKWDLVLLGYNYPGFTSPVDKRGVPLALAGRRGLGNGLSWGKLISVRFFGSQAYAVSLAGAKRLLGQSSPLRYQADLLLAGGAESSLNVAAFSPRAIGLGSFSSTGTTIEGRDWAFPEKKWKSNFRQRFGYLYTLTKRVYLLNRSCLILILQLLRL